MKVDILAFGAHPDDVELGCAGSLSKAKELNKSVAIIDLTLGELGTRGNSSIRIKESTEAAKLLGVNIRENLGFKDGFFVNDESHQIKIIKKIRQYCPQIVLCNTFEDRHIDHGKANALVNDSCFLSGLSKIETYDEKSEIQKPWRPKIVLEYIQWNETKPDIILDISRHLETKIKCVSAYKSQFFDPKSKELDTPISSKNFIESVKYRAKNLGRLIGVEAGEGYTSRQPLSVESLDALVRR